MEIQWASSQAFSRNRGLISSDEQDILANSLVALPGCGGIGSTVAETLARIGIGRFKLCDSDHFDIANFNRQVGATIETVGVNKALATKARILSINPTAKVEIVPQLVSKETADDFVRDCHLVLDGIDFFAISARRALFKAAWNARIPAMTAAPMGFSATLQVYFNEKGMSFEQFFDYCDQDSNAELLAKFLIGLAPNALHRSYTDFSYIDAKAHTGPSSIIGTQLASALIGAESVRILLKRGSSLTAPWFQQFDSYNQVWVKKKLMFGNRHPMQKLKLRMAKKAFVKSGVWQDLMSSSCT